MKTKVIEFVKIFSFSYIFIGISYVIFERLYAFIKGYETTFSIFVDLIIAAPFWPLIPEVNLIGAMAMITVGMMLLKFKALNYKMIESIVTVFQIFLFTAIVFTSGIYLLGIYGIFLNSSLLFLLPFITVGVIYAVIRFKRSQ